MNNEKDKNIALLIDCENISYRYVETIFSELKAYGNITIRKAYGDFSQDFLAPWKPYFNEFSITPMLSIQYTSGKNSSDSQLIIDAMDILFREPIDIFCFVSSDADFSSIVSRIRQSGKTVIGMGESKSPKALVNACDRFVFLNLVAEDSSDESEDNKKSSGAAEENNVTPIEKIKSDIIAILESTDTGEANLGLIAQTLQKKRPDFDPRNYGYSKFSKFISQFSEDIEINITGQNNFAQLKTSKKRMAVEKYIVGMLEKAPNKTMRMSDIKNQLLKKYPNFNQKDYGYKQWKLFLTDMDGIILVKRSRVKLDK